MAAHGFTEMPERVATLRVRRVSPAGHSLLGMNEPLVVFPFRYRDAPTGKWVKARYKATPEEIAARYAEWEITGRGEVRRPIGGYFNPNRREGEQRSAGARYGRRTITTYFPGRALRVVVDPDRPQSMLLRSGTP